MAATRALDRAIALGQADTPGHSALVARISAARRALGAGDRAQARHRIDAALAG